MASTVPDLSAESLPPALLAAVRAGEATSALRLPLGARGAHALAIRPIRDVEGRLGATIVLGVGLSTWEEAARDTAIYLLGALALVLGLAVPVALWAARSTWPSPISTAPMRSGAWPPRSRGSAAA